MAELDVEALKPVVAAAEEAARQPHAPGTEETAYVGAANLVVLSPELFLSMHAALEDRDRLREAGQAIIDYSYRDPGWLTNDQAVQILVHLAKLVENLKAALEDHDG